MINNYYTTAAVKKAINYLSENSMYNEFVDEHQIFFNVGSWCEHLSRKQIEDIPLVAALALTGSFNVNIEEEEYLKIKNFFFPE